MEANRTSPLKYADTGIRLTISKMEQRGARRSRLVAKIAGGAKMFDVAGNGSLGSIGQRNIDSVHQVLQQERVRLVREDVGGRSARTLLFDVAPGEGCIKDVRKAEKLLRHNSDRRSGNYAGKQARQYLTGIGNQRN